MKETPLAFALTLCLVQQGYASELYFPPEFFASDEQSVADLSHFNTTGVQLPGVYQVDVYLNNEFFGSKNIAFTTGSDKINKWPKPVRDSTGLIPCLSVKYLSSLGVKVSLYSELVSMDENQCLIPGLVIPEAYTKFTYTTMRLDISIPQAALFNKPRGYIEPELWDEGINSGLLNYNFNASNSYGGQQNSDSYYLNLNSGLNIGAWRFRDFRTWNYYHNSNRSYQQWQRLKTYAERTIIPFRSNLVIGDSTTAGTIFDSVGFKGIQLETDDNMYPDTMRGFAPVVRGIAGSNAQVTIIQNGYNIYQTNVAPGAFEITDLFPVYSSGDLEVRIQEASGEVRVFTVPYSSVPLLQREGHVKYSLTAGRFSYNSDSYDDPVFVQGTLLWGLPHGMTTYGGLQYSDNFMAGQLGAGINLGRLGAISADLTHADSTLADGSKHKGQSVRFLYSNAFTATGTTFRLTGYRYSTRGFHTLDETALKNMSGRLYDHSVPDETGHPVQDTYSDYYNLYNSKRARMEMSVSQSVGDLGSLFLSGVRQTYWKNAEANDSLSMGISSSIGAMNYSLGYSYSRQKVQHKDDWKNRSVNLSVSIPLDRLMSTVGGKSSIYATASVSHDNHGNASQQAGLSGTALDSRNLNWNISQGYSQHQGSSGYAGMNYRGGYGNANVGYSYSQDYQRLSYGISGGAILHRNGLTLGQPLGDTSVLVAAPGATDLAVSNETGVKTDWRGYAIMPYASAYRENRVSLETVNEDEYTEVDNTVLRLVPTKGAIVRAQFKVTTGYRVLMYLHKHNGKDIPFGTIVTAGNNSGIVGDNGLVYLSGMPEKGKLIATWGNQPDQRCTVEYKLNLKGNDGPIIHTEGTCK